MNAATMPARFRAVRATTESLSALLSPEDQNLQSMPDCSPVKWHRSHTTWFFETFVLQPHLPGWSPVDATYGYLFNSYYEALGRRQPRPQRGLLSRPDHVAVAAYRRLVDEGVERLLEAGPLTDDVADALALGLAHEEQHQELLLGDITHAFAQHPFRPVMRGPAPAPVRSSPAPLTFRGHAGGLVSIGAAPGSGFTFDSERPRHEVFVQPFALAERPVVVADVLAFIADGGYASPAHWLSEGWSWVRANDVTAPGYARVEDGALVTFGPDGEREASPSEPASHLSFYEADAIARWSGHRLPTEAEWEVAASSVALEGNFLDSGLWRPRAGSTGLFGDTWTWTASPYVPYPGFRPLPGAFGEYNGKFMVNQLVLRGGSAWSPPGHLRATYRNFWPAHTRFQLTGARLAKDL